MILSYQSYQLVKKQVVFTFGDCARARHACRTHPLCSQCTGTQLRTLLCRRRRLRGSLIVCSYLSVEIAPLCYCMTPRESTKAHSHVDLTNRFFLAFGSSVCIAQVGLSRYQSVSPELQLYNLQLCMQRMQKSALIRGLIKLGWQLNGRNRVLHRYWFWWAEIIWKIVLSIQGNKSSMPRFMYT